MEHTDRHTDRHTHTHTQLYIYRLLLVLFIVMPLFKGQDGHIYKLSLDIYKTHKMKKVIKYKAYRMISKLKVSLIRHIYKKT